MKYAFFIDFDGTLTFNKTIPKRNTDAIAKAQRDGHLFILNTGRSKAFVPKYAFDSVAFDGLIAGSGMYCETAGEILRSEALDPVPLTETLGFFLKRGREFLLEGETKVLYYGSYGKDEGFCPIESPLDAKMRFPGERYQKLLVFGEADEEERAFMSERFETECIKEYSECSTKGINKGNGFRLVAERLGNGYTTVAIGDSVNDLSCFKEADISVAVGNAPDEIKQKCDMTVSPNSDGGVGDAIEKLISGLRG